jgi:Lysyl-tRNA synthetase (class II)
MNIIKNVRINNEQKIERKPTRMVKDNEHIEDLNDQMLVRREKMNELREKGIDPFGSRYEPTHFSADLVKEYDKFSKEELQEKEIPAKISGRLMAKRGSGKAGFANLKIIKGLFKFMFV